MEKLEPIDPMMMRFVLGVVASGGTLAISGPSFTAPLGSPRYGASLESSSGAIHADAYGDTLHGVLQELERQWRAQCPNWPPTHSLLEVDGQRVGVNP